MPEEPVPTDLLAVSRLLQRLTGQPKAINEENVIRAASLLEKIIHSENPADVVAERLDEIDELLPALIELNIRQAQADGRHELAEALRGLQLNIDYQLDVKDNDQTATEKTVAATPLFKGNILLLLPDTEKKSRRMALLKPALEGLGCHVSEKGNFTPGRDAKPDVVIASNPHTNPAMGQSLATLSTLGVPIILDLDSDFEKQPVFHPEYATRGLGTQTRSNVYTSALSLAKIVSVPSETQAASLKGVVEQVCYIPDGWSQKNKLWDKNPPARSSINIGWVGSSGQLEDLLFVRRYILRIMREFPDTRIVITGNPQAYRLFETLPENRRLYLPVVSHEEFPYLLSQMDILLLPLRNLPYNLSAPDTLLVDAGARSIPWIASPMPAFRRWSAGGMIAETPDEWHLNLRHMVKDHELRSNLGRAGRYAARTREMEQVGLLWLETIAQAASAGIFSQRK